MYLSLPLLGIVQNVIKEPRVELQQGGGALVTPESSSLAWDTMKGITIVTVQLLLYAVSLTSRASSTRLKRNRLTSSQFWSSETSTFVSVF